PPLALHDALPIFARTPPPRLGKCCAMQALRRRRLTRTPSAAGTNGHGNGPHAPPRAAALLPGRVVTDRLEHFGQWRRTAEQETLGLVAAVVAQPFQLA